MAGSDDLEVVRRTGFQHGVPHILGVLRRILEVDLVALLTGESGLGDDDVAAADLGFHESVARQCASLLSDEIGDDVD